ncbi:MAG: sulfotransferase [Xanthomonadales bacterium]|nr:sulfotransferase [Xanthomonadales bacterium]
MSKPENNLPKQTVLLVGGAMRSGTTVIHRALCTASNSNPYISESWFLHELFILFERNMRRFEVRHQDQFGERAEFARLINLNLNYYVEMVSARYGNPAVLIFKHPELTGHFITIKQLAPEMKFLVIVRDPRDVIASIKAVNARHAETGTWSPHGTLSSMKQFCEYYASYYNTVFAQRADFGSNLMFVRYEDVVSNPVKTFAHISAFSGATYADDAMTKFTDEHAQAKNFQKDLRLKDPLSGAYWSEMYTKDLSTERIGSYAQSLAASDVEEIQTRLSGFGKSFRYW